MLISGLGTGNRRVDGTYFLYSDRPCSWMQPWPRLLGISRS